MPIPVAGFPSKKAARVRCREVKAARETANNPGRLTPQEAYELGPLFARHPSPAVNQAEFWGVTPRVDYPRKGFRTWGFSAWTGEDWKPFSYETAINGSYNFMSDMRLAVRDDIWRVREEWGLTDSEHLDHHPVSFATLVERWICRRGVVKRELKQNGLAPELLRDWSVFHRRFAGYQPLPAAENLRKGRDDG